MGYEHLANTLRAIAITAPAACALELTVEFALGEGKETATVGRLEDHFRDRPPRKACLGYPAFMTLDLGAIALGMMRVEGWGQQVAHVRESWDMADRIKPLMGVRWEEGLDKPVDVWRRELDVEPVRHGQNSWYEVLAGLDL
jgi:hypothetical protein